MNGKREVPEGPKWGLCLMNVGLETQSQTKVPIEFDTSRSGSEVVPEDSGPWYDRGRHWEDLVLYSGGTRGRESSRVPG